MRLSKKQKGRIHDMVGSYLSEVKTDTLEFSKQVRLGEMMNLTQKGIVDELVHEIHSNNRVVGEIRGYNREALARYNRKLDNLLPALKGMAKTNADVFVLNLLLTIVQELYDDMQSNTKQYLE